MANTVRITVATLGAFATTALAHGTVSGFVTDGTYNQGFLLDYFYENANSGSFPKIAAWYAENMDNGFVAPESYGTSDINCHVNAEAAPLTSTVSAGGTVEFQWTTWPHGIGPVLTYVANCNGDCAAADKAALRWVKIDEAGINIETQTWAAQDLIDNNNTWVTTVPSTLAPGNYVFRHEIIALHGAGTENGAQNYPQCMNIEITGSGTENPQGTLGTELYTATDSGILFNPYGTITEYVIPGPALYRAGSSSGSDGSVTSSATATSTGSVVVETSAVLTTQVPETTSVAVETTETGTIADTPTTSAAHNTLSTSAQPTTLVTSTRSVAPSATPDSGSSQVQGLYEQCGGSSWAGSTTCVDGAICKEWNEWYYQCVSA